MKTDQFYIVGAQRSGSTFFYRILEDHPDICMARPMKPEPKYFIDEDMYREDLKNYYTLYYSHFANEKALGEKSVSYFEIEDAAIRIANGFPDSKILVILRDPANRALSNYYFSKENGLETRTIEEAFLENKPEPQLYTSSVSPFAYIDRGKYIDYINMYLKYFSKDQVYVVILEELIGNLSTVQQTFNFLGVSKDFIPKNYELPVNKGETDRVETSNEVESYLQTLFTPYNLSLESYLGRDLNCWKKKNKEY